MKAALALTVAALLAFTLPAQAQVIIEEAPGAEGASMEPTHFLNTETARILPANLNVIGLGGGGLFSYGVGSLQYARGMGLGGELHLSALYFQSFLAIPPSTSGVPAPTHSFGGGLGYKQRLAIVGPWDVAVNGYGTFSTGGLYPAYSLQVGLPSTTMLGPGDLTLQPRAFFPDFRGLAGPLNPWTFGLTAGYRVPLGPVRLLFEAGASYLTNGFIAPSGRVGLRYAALPNLHIDLQGGFEPMGVAAHPGRLDNTPVSAALRFSL